MDLTGCGEIGQSQDGLITRRQALKFLTKSEIEHLFQIGAWCGAHPGVYRMCGAPLSWLQTVRAATLAHDNELVAAAGQTAGYIWGFVERKPQPIEVLSPVGTSPRISGVTHHRTRNWHADIARTVNGILVTSPARTIIDMSANTYKWALLHAVDLAITTKRVTLDEIAGELDVIGSQGRSRCSLLFDVLSQRSIESEKTQSPSEIEALAWIVNAGLPAPVAQHPVEGTNYTIDLAYPDLKLGIEMLSWKWHGGPQKFEEDQRRKAKCIARGWCIIEFTRKTTEHDLVAAVKATLARF